MAGRAIFKHPGFALRSGVRLNLHLLWASLLRLELDIFDDTRSAGKIGELLFCLRIPLHVDFRVTFKLTNKHNRKLIP